MLSMVGAIVASYVYSGNRPAIVGLLGVGSDTKHMMDILAQVVGVFGLVFALSSFQLKKRKHIMLFQMLASMMFSAQFFMLGAFTGGCMDLISFVRTLIFSNNNKKWASSKWWLVGFIVVMIVTGIMTWQDGWSIFAILGSILSTVALWMKKEKHIRMVSLTVGPCWIVYGIVTGAYTSVLNEVLALASIVIGMLRHDRKKISQEKKEGV